MRERRITRPLAATRNASDPGTRRSDEHRQLALDHVTRSVCGKERSYANVRTPGSGVERARHGVAVDSQQAPAHARGERRAHLGPQGGRAAANLDSPHREDRGLTGAEVGADASASSARPIEHGPSGRRDAGELGHRAARRAAPRRARSTSGGRHAADFAATAGFPYSGWQLERAEESNLVLEHDPEPIVHAPARLGHQREAVCAEVAPPAFSMKFAWRGEISAPPIRWPLSPHSSIRRPAPTLARPGS